MTMTGDQGLVGLCTGAKATIVIPPEMGYGASGAGADIPGGATVSGAYVQVLASKILGLQ